MEANDRLMILTKRRRHMLNVFIVCRRREKKILKVVREFFTTQKFFFNLHGLDVIKRGWGTLGGMKFNFKLLTFL